MIGFVSAISASLAVIILVSLASLVAFVQSILPASGLVKINDNKYRYVMEGQFLKNDLIEEVVTQIYNHGLSARVETYQNGCNYGFNIDQQQSHQISTYNYIVMNGFFQESTPVLEIVEETEKSKINVCFIDINLKPAKVK
jgi:hypothetical protein